MSHFMIHHYRRVFNLSTSHPIGPPAEFRPCEDLYQIPRVCVLDTVRYGGICVIAIPFVNMNSKFVGCVNVPLNATMESFFLRPYPVLNADIEVGEGLIVCAMLVLVLAPT